jgi:hypothetical protein
VARSFEILIPVMVVIGTLHPLNLFIEAQTGMIIPQAIAPAGAAGPRLTPCPPFCSPCCCARSSGSPVSTAR